MSKRRRGMTIDEKRQVLSELLYEMKEPFDLKELEKLGSKRGVVSQSVKDVLQSLVDDDLVELEKIGIKNFYWSFPSKALRMQQNRAEKMEGVIKENEEAIEAATARIAELSAEREETDERASKVRRLEEARDVTGRLEREIEEHKYNDPEVIRELEHKVQTAKEATDRWTDNVWVLKDHLVKRMGRTAAEIDRALEINDDFDYVTIK